MKWKFRLCADQRREWQRYKPWANRHPIGNGPDQLLIGVDPWARRLLDLALHIIKKKAGRFDPTTFDDRYDTRSLKLSKVRQVSLCDLDPSSA